MGDPLLGRKPRWVARWEERSQARFDRAFADDKVRFVERQEQARHDAQRDVVVVGRGGDGYRVRAVPKGEPLHESDLHWAVLEVGAGLGGWIGFAIGAAVGLLREGFVAARTRMSSGWTVGVMRTDPEVDVVHTEWVSDEEAAIARVRDLTARVDAGDFDRPPRR